MSKATAPASEKAPAVQIPDAPLSDWTTEQIIAVYPKMPPRPIEDYTSTELVALKNMGPATLGGALYVAAQHCASSTSEGVLGPAILSKGFTPVPFVTQGV